MHVKAHVESVLGWKSWLFVLTMKRCIISVYLCSD